jgi:hypothetical protein
MGVYLFRYRFFELMKIKPMRMTATIPTAPKMKGQSFSRTAPARNPKMAAKSATIPESMHPLLSLPIRFGKRKVSRECDKQSGSAAGSTLKIDARFFGKPLYPGSYF